MKYSKKVAYSLSLILCTIGFVYAGNLPEERQVSIAYNVKVYDPEGVPQGVLLQGATVTINPNYVKDGRQGVVFSNGNIAYVDPRAILEVDKIPIDNSNIGQVPSAPISLGVSVSSKDLDQRSLAGINVTALPDVETRYPLYKQDTTIGDKGGKSLEGPVNSNFVGKGEILDPNTKDLGNGITEMKVLTPDGQTSALIRVSTDQQGNTTYQRFLVDDKGGRSSVSSVLVVDKYGKEVASDKIENGVVDGTRGSDFNQKPDPKPDQNFIDANTNIAGNSNALYYPPCTGFWCDTARALGFDPRSSNPVYTSNSPDTNPQDLNPGKSVGGINAPPREEVPESKCYFCFFDSGNKAPVVTVDTPAINYINGNLLDQDERIYSTGSATVDPNTGSSQFRIVANGKTTAFIDVKVDPDTGYKTYTKTSVDPVTGKFENSSTVTIDQNGKVAGYSENNNSNPDQGIGMTAPKDGVNMLGVDKVNTGNNPNPDNSDWGQLNNQLPNQNPDGISQPSPSNWGPSYPSAQTPSSGFGSVPGVGYGYSPSPSSQAGTLPDTNQVQSSPGSSGPGISQPSPSNWGPSYSGQQPDQAPPSQGGSSPDPSSGQGVSQGSDKTLDAHQVTIGGYTINIPQTFDQFDDLSSLLPDFGFNKPESNSNNYDGGVGYNANSAENASSRGSAPGNGACRSADRTFIFKLLGKDPGC